MKDFPTEELSFMNTVAGVLLRLIQYGAVNQFVKQ
jgi:hypothetical protein